MKKLNIVLICFSLLFVESIQGQNKWSLKIPEVTILGRRPMKEIGTQETKLDSVVLQEVVGYAMSDVLSQNSTIFIKQYGRATLSTASFRGTSPSHTQVMWNGMKLNSPMLGMVDFSMIPSYFIDDATLLHGTSSINVTGGGLGGAITLSNNPVKQQGLNLQYIQGLSSFQTMDEFLRLTYGDKYWHTSTRIAYSSSENQYKYRNYNKKEYTYDENYNITGSYYPIERNKSGDFHDLNILQEAYYTTKKEDKFGLSAWYTESRRGVPMLNVDYREDAEYTNKKQENTFRGVLSWNRNLNKLKMGARTGYTHTNLGYDYTRDLGNGTKANMIHSRSYVNTFYGAVNADYYLSKKWLFTANASLNQHFVKSQDKNIITQSGNKAVVGYDQARIEISGYVSAKWQPTDRLGTSLAIREDRYGNSWTPVIPAAFFDYVLSKRGNVIAKTSISRNYRFPTLNDLYFLPGGNPDLKTERGFTYDGSIEFTVGKQNRYTLRGSATWFDSYINDWIVWLPTFKGFWTPKNIKQVHAYGIEIKSDLNMQLSSEWNLRINGNFAWTPSINHGDPVNWADSSIGKQLVYIPEYSSALTGRLSWRSWHFTYKWCYYSERYTTSSNETTTKIGRVLPYFMNDLSLEKQFSLRWANLSVKGLINNLFNEEYESVLSHPMPRINYGIMIDIQPKW
ncbi:TonB-dependent receptor plug domain-containing protein [uncultured Bacteroides sp.]|uniref:TonB-dependent receptor n=1 Tax=uncultured Bacteroides sp. TaxID=162156 RepID=UPI002AA65336|nr:TonB-dependent receptor plug domain-containing protein [uncultured Bacteroides sp.]